jgi:hypothetical protein
MLHIIASLARPYRGPRTVAPEMCKVDGPTTQLVHVSVPEVLDGATVTCVHRAVAAEGPGL